MTKGPAGPSVHSGFVRLESVLRYDRPVPGSDTDARLPRGPKEKERGPSRIDSDQPACDRLSQRKGRSLIRLRYWTPMA